MTPQAAPSRGAGLNRATLLRRLLTAGLGGGLALLAGCAISPSVEPAEVAAAATAPPSAGLPQAEVIALFRNAHISGVNGRAESYVVHYSERGQKLLRVNNALQTGRWWINEADAFCETLTAAQALPAAPPFKLCAPVVVPTGAEYRVFDSAGQLLYRFAIATPTPTPTP